MEIERLRRQRWTGKQIASETGVSPATVTRVLRRLGLNALSALEPAEPIVAFYRFLRDRSRVIPTGWWFQNLCKPVLTGRR